MPSFVRWRAPWTSSAEHVATHHPVLGTVLQLRITARSTAVAERAEAAVLAELERVQAIYSVFDPNSEFSRWRTGSDAAANAHSVSSELSTLLAHAEHWQYVTGGVFNPAVGELSELWKQAESAQMIPSHEECQAKADRVQDVRFQVDESGTVTRVGDCSQLNFHAIAKGRAVDLAALAALAVSGVSRVVVNIGGDLCHRGHGDLAVGVEDPARPYDNAAPLCQVRLANEGMATSGPTHRGVRIAEQWFSHVIDPRNGWPVDRIRSASVIGPDAETADVAATVLSVLKPQESLAWLDAQPGRLAGMVIHAETGMHSNQAWNDRLLNERPATSSGP